jgi:glycosyltransferase involved in cell wall biosynthesis
MKPAMALIISTCDQPDYLRRVLRAVSGQLSPPAEVLLADDGSDETTARVFQDWAAAQSCRCEHLWQPHEGFRKARILNEAIARARAECVVFLDGDTVPHPRFIGDHQQLARPERFVQGHRALIGRRAARNFGEGNFRTDRWQALLGGGLSGWKNAFRWPAPLRRLRRDLRGVRGCNLAIWREHLAKVNGYNEEFTGWGREDSELAVRLLNNGVLRVDVRGWALCYHLWHPPLSRSHLPANDQLLAAAVAEARKSCRLGLSLHPVPAVRSRGFDTKDFHGA